MTDAALEAPTAATDTPVKVFWFIPTHGDGRYLGTSVGGRQTDLGYMGQIAAAADQLGYYGVLLPTGRSCEDSWVVASALIPQTKRLRFLIAARPGLQSPSVAARMAATFDRLSNGRLLINVVTGGDPVENRGDGLFLSHTERYALTEEFLNVFVPLLRGETVNYSGKHVQVEESRLLFPPFQEGGVPLFFGGSSDAGIAVAAKTVDTYLTWGEPPADVEKKLKVVRRAAEEQGRTLRFGIRLHVIVRETRAAAWAAAEALIQHVSDDTIAAAQKIFSRMDSVGQQRMRELHGGNGPTWKSAPISGPVSVWCGAGPEPRWSAMPKRLRRGCGNTETWGSRASSCRVIRILRNRIVSPSSSFLC